MGLNDLHLEKGYNFDRDNPLKDFYIPVLSNSKRYWRLTGYFSSNVIRAAAQGVRNLIKNGGTMRLVTGLQFNAQDKKMMEEGVLGANEAIVKNLNEQMDKLSKEDFTLQPARVFGWMLKHNVLEIKLVDVFGVPGIYHPKVGILFDESGGSISFSGGNNESEMGWDPKKGNVDSFKVFKAGDDAYYDIDINDFLSYWNRAVRRCKVYDLPDAIKERLISIAPPNYEDEDLGYDDGVRNQSPQSQRPLWEPQRIAIAAWSDPATWRDNLEPDLTQFLENQSTDPVTTNNHPFQGILSMCTASGKTYAAVNAACLADVNVITIIAMPLSIRQQWEDEIKLVEPYAKIIYGGGKEDNWKDFLPNHLAKYREGVTLTNTQRLFILCTYPAICSDPFVKIFEGIPSQYVQVIGDEVHHFVKQAANAFNIKADRVLGLSATHTRHFDPVGTAGIVGYFGDSVYDFNIQDGIANNILCRYTYHQHIVSLTTNELTQYREASKKIAILEGEEKKAKREHSSKLASISARLIIAKDDRASILRQADNKPAVVDDIVRTYFSGEKEKAIIFCDGEDQTKDIQEKLLDQKDKIFYEYSSEREKISKGSNRAVLELFKNTDASRFLLAIDCLDEGLDVPESDKCILVASTTNPRQFIQRRGRVLRKSEKNPNKIAQVHDTIVLPNYSFPAQGGKSPKEKEEDKKEAERMAAIIQKEINRLTLMSDSAENLNEVTQELRQWITAHRLQDFVNV